MPQRRLNPDPRIKRKRVPAYQVRRGQRAVSESHPVAPVEAQPDAPESTPAPQPATTLEEPTRASEPPEGASQPVDEVVSNESAEPEAPLIDDQQQEQDPSVDAAGDGAEQGTTGDRESDLAEYAESVESAAQRNRDEVQLTADDTTAFPIVPAPPRAEPRIKPIAGRRVRAGQGARPPGNGGSATTAATPDPRPILKRPKTWFVVALMIVAIAGIGGVLWSLNLLRVSYQAYNDAHVDAADRPVYRVNEQGTPEIVPTEEVQASLPNWEEKDPFNILLMGVDTRPNDIFPPRSDTIIVVHIDPVSKAVSMMSIPRDLSVRIPGFGSDKINAAYTFGEEQDENGGPALVAQTIEANFGIRIHYFITVDFNGFRDVIDTIGGVVIDVPAPVKDDMYPTEELGYTRQYFPAGLQKMDGETALRYARTRHNDNDIMRGERQQQMLMAIREHAVNLGLITRAENLLRQLGDTVRYDLNFNQLLALANLGREIRTGDIQRISLWDTGALYEEYIYDENTEQNVYYMEADWSVVQDLMEQHFGSERTAEVTSSPPPAETEPRPTVTATATATATAAATETQAIPEATPVPATPEPTPTATPTVVPETADFTVPVIVENDSTLNFVATNISDVLTQAGFVTVIPETGSQVFETTIIYDYAESPATARYIADYLGLPESSIVYSSGGNGIVVAVGQDLGIEYGSE